MCMCSRADSSTCTRKMSLRNSSTWPQRNRTLTGHHQLHGQLTGRPLLRYTSCSQSGIRSGVPRGTTSYLRPSISTRAGRWLLKRCWKIQQSTWPGRFFCWPSICVGPVVEIRPSCTWVWQQSLLISLGFMPPPNTSTSPKLNKIPGELVTLRFRFPFTLQDHSDPSNITG
jgi:hypothetical protein